jgi:hypothetical protein
MESERSDKAKQRDKSWRLVWPLVVLALLCVIFYWDALWLSPERIIAGNDLTSMFLNWLRFAKSSLGQGELPFWNPYLFSGLPFVANPQPALFYPPTWLVLLMPVTRALGLIIVLHVWLSSAGMYLWLCSEGASAAGALFGGTVLAFSGYFFVRVYAGHLGVVTTGAWLPLLLWTCRQVEKHHSWKVAVVGGLPLGLSILAGHTASFIYVALGLSTYAVLCAWRTWQEEQSAWATGRHLLLLSVMALTGVALAAVQLLPMGELVAHSARQAGAGYDFATRFSWPPGYLLTLLIPNLFGEPAHTGYWGDGVYDEFIFYVGVLPLILALLGLKMRHRLKPFLVTLGLGALLLALGKFGILHRLFYRFLPVFRVMRAPARAGFLFTVASAASAGLMVTALQESTSEDRRRLLAPLKEPLLLTVIGMAVFLIVTGFAAFAWGREVHEAAGRLWHLANHTALFLLFFLLAAVLLIKWRETHSTSALWPLALGLVIVDLWTFGAGLVEPVDVHTSDYWRTVAQAIDDAQTNRVLPWGLGHTEQNGGMSFGIRSLFGYDPLILQRYEDFVSSWPDPRAQTYDLLNAGYLVAKSPLELPDEPETPQLLLEQSGVHVYERPNAMPRAWITPQIEVMSEKAMLTHIHEQGFDPRATALVESDLKCESAGANENGEVKVVRYENTQIETRVDSDGGLLIFSEVDYPGWRATVDGEPAPIVRANYLLRAVCVPEGQHRVTLVYDPPLLKIGLAITALTLACIVGIAISLRKKQ